MGKAIVQLAMSLDGFIADAADGVWDLYGWLTNGDTELQMGGMTFKTSATSAAYYKENTASVGAAVTGRRDFDISEAWGGKHPYNLPAFIVTHHPPEQWTGPDSPFTFVTDGVESAIAQAKAAAGGKHVSVNGSSVVQQGLAAGAIDELQIDLIPILLGSGVRLFNNLTSTPIELECTRVVPAPGVTHLTYKVHYR